MSGYLFCVCSIMVWANVVLSTNEDISQEYCADESFKPTCHHNEVIVMKHALYGRMNVGRCVSVDVGSCSEDVLSWMDEKCSGQMECQVEIPNRDLNDFVPCSKEYMPYLEASYECISVVNPESQGGCSNTISVTSRTLAIASSISKKTNCGFPSSPWSLQAKKGQRINITMTDFRWKVKDKDRPTKCPVKYGYIIDIHAQSTGNEVIDICGTGSRQKNIYVSTGNLIQIIFQDHIVDEHNFLLQVQAIGCPDFNPPRNAWMRKEPNKLTIGCHGSSNQWDLSCQGNRWMGTYGSCPEDMPVVHSAEERQSTIPNVISLSLIGSTTVVICCIAVTSIIVCFCYRKFKVETPEAEYFTTTALPSGNTTMPLPSGTIVSYKTYRPVSTMNRQSIPSRMSVNTNSPFQTDTFTGQIINTSAEERPIIIDEVIYDDPANLDINNVQYMNQFNSLNSTGTGMVNSLQYTKLQKQRQ